MKWLKNISLNLRATGPAAVAAVLVISIAAVGIWGGENGGFALVVLMFIGVGIATALIKPPHK